MHFLDRRSLAALALLAACDASTTSPSGTGSPFDGKADDTDAGGASLVFDAEWEETQTGPLVAGRRARIRYDLERLSECRAEMGGTPQWGATAVYHTDGGDLAMLPLTELRGGEIIVLEPELIVPEGETLTLFFYASNRYGCVAYDSDYGGDYRFPIEHATDAATLRFAVGEEPVLEGSLVAGGQLTIEYDLERLPECRGQRYGHPSWDVWAAWVGSDEGTELISLTESDGSERHGAARTITVPDREELEMWFSSSDAYGCRSYDSRSGENHRFAVSR